MADVIVLILPWLEETWLTNRVNWSESFFRANSCSTGKEIPNFYGTWSITVVFKTVFHWTLSWANRIQSTPIDIFYEDQFSFKNISFAGFPTKIFCTFLTFHMGATRERWSIFQSKWKYPSYIIPRFTDFSLIWMFRGWGYYHHSHAFTPVL
jgi:hypothetical protein